MERHLTLPLDEPPRREFKLSDRLTIELAVCVPATPMTKASQIRRPSSSYLKKGQLKTDVTKYDHKLPTKVVVHGRQVRCSSWVGG